MRNMGTQTSTAKKTESLICFSGFLFWFTTASLSISSSSASQPCKRWSHTWNQFNYSHHIQFLDIKWVDFLLRDTLLQFLLYQVQKFLPCLHFHSPQLVSHKAPRMEFFTHNYPPIILAQILLPRRRPNIQYLSYSFNQKAREAPSKSHHHVDGVSGVNFLAVNDY